ncbi:MAG: PEGA domain-containing protein [Deltaproteobacteria bacterium]|nr:PEGA domain-containing protein [Deltaproteobacteria bacterium]
MRAFTCLLMAGVFSIAFSARAQTPPKCTGWLQVEAGAVAGASIEVDGVLRKEVTPATLKDVLCGKHRVRVFKAHYKDASRRVMVRLGEVTPVKVKLRENFGFLTVKSEPSGALLRVDGKVLGKTPVERQLVGKGRHTVSVEMSEFETETKKVNIRKGKTESLEFKLKSNVAMLSLSAEPAEAIITLDGKKLGLGPIDWMKVDGGKHEARAEFPDHVTAVEKFNIRKGQQLNLTLKPRPRYAAIEIASEPAGAILWLDGIDLGPTPLRIERTPVGKHALRLTHPLYQTHKQTLHTKPGKTAQITVKLKSAHGKLLLRTDPPGGFVLVDGMDLGYAPLLLKLAPGYRLVRAGASDEDHGFAEKRVRVKKGRNKDLTLKLPGHMGTLAIDSIPKGAAIRVDGKARGKAPLKLELPVGPHVIEAKLGKKDLLGWVEVRYKQASKVGLHIEQPMRSVFFSPEQKEPVVKTKLADLKRPEDGADLLGTDASAKAAAPMSIRRIFAWTTAGLAGVGVVAGLAFLGVGLSVDKDANDAYLEWLRVPTQINQDKYNDLDAKASDLFLGGWVGLGAGVAIAGLSAYLFLSEPEVEVDLTGPEGMRSGLVWGILPEGGGCIGYQGSW